MEGDADPPANLFGALPELGLTGSARKMAIVGRVDAQSLRARRLALSPLRRRQELDRHDQRSCDHSAHPRSPEATPGVPTSRSAAGTSPVRATVLTRTGPHHGDLSEACPPRGIPTCPGWPSRASFSGSHEPILTGPEGAARRDSRHQESRSTGPTPFHRLSTQWLLGQDEKAEQVLTTGIERHPGDFILHNVFGLLLRRSGRSEEAAQQFAIASRMTGEHPFLKGSHALCLRLAGDREGTNRLLAEVDENPEDLRLNDDAKMMLAVARTGDARVWLADLDRALDRRSVMPPRDHPEVVDVTRRLWPA
jgi:hypothetical protein